MQARERASLLSFEWKTLHDGGSFIVRHRRWCDKSDLPRLHVTAVPRRSAAVAARAGIKHDDIASIIAED
jgi:hypothetical protein